MFLGVDGGGTKTGFMLIDAHGHILASHEEPTSYYLEIGMQATEQVLRRGTLAVLDKAQFRMEDLRFAFFGLPAYGEDSSLQDQLETLPSTFLPAARYRCGNDMVCGWAGSLAGQDGISVVAGTGSIAYGEYQGRQARAGGWGELFSDEGSAYWIACAGLKLFSRMSDGRADIGPLYELVRERFDLRSDLDLCGHVYGKLGAQRGAMAQISQLVGEAALLGDEQARIIFSDAASELVELISAVRNTLKVPSNMSLPISYSGGVFKSGALLMEPLRAALTSLPEFFTLTEPILSPVIGAALYAAKCCEYKLHPDALARLVVAQKLSGAHSQ
ncbi:MAG TPA: BadF/BadG/BcrA/BcrD ATPase family protein [Burkholderiaceae bacterium]